MDLAENRRPGLWIEIGVLVAILAVAGCLRLIQLDAVPPGMTHDEAAFGAEAERVLSGDRPIYFSLGYGHEPAYAYLVALAFALLGRTLTALRVTSAMCGLLVVLGTYLVGRRMFGSRVALVSAAWMAVAFWPLSLSRQALRAVTLPMLWLPAAWLFWAGLRGGSGTQEAASHTYDRVSIPSWWRGAIRWLLSGLFLGATFYTYMSSRAAWAVFPLFALYLLLQRETRGLLRRVWPGILAMLVVTGLVALPLGLYLRAHPGDERRFGDMMVPVRELLRGEPERALRHAWNAVRVFSWVGDTFWVYNIPGRPVLNWASSAFFYAGLALALWHWRDARYAFLVLWLAVGMAPAMVTTNQGIFLRAIVAQPATYLFVAVGLETVGARRRTPDAQRDTREAIRNRWRRASIPSEAMDTVSNIVPAPRAGQGAQRRDAPWQALWTVLAVVLVSVEGARTYQAYFVDWPSRPEARTIYNHNLVATARYLDAMPKQGAVGISTLYPLYYHDPWIVRYVRGRDDPELRWFDGRGGIVYPSEGEARYVFSALTPLDPALRAEFERQAALIERRELAPDDENPTFEVWQWRGGEDWQREIEELRERSPMWLSDGAQFSQPDLWQPLAGPARFGDVMSLVGYRLNAVSFQPGDEIELVTYWRALHTVQAQDDWVTFVHLLDGNSRVIGGTDVLHCPPTGWQPDDVVVQVHRFTVAAEAPRGREAALEVGVYRRPDERQPVLLEGQVVSDRVLLDPIEVR